ncbi:MAG: J domain-containing protein [Rhodospirillaceae bacterium]|nr:J domain-containing protein [Rhodospirillaceae bacterium]MEA4839283.1 J domain-containing protein [Rhodospirillaceae bacterium]
MNRHTRKFHRTLDEDEAASCGRDCDHPGCVGKGEYRAPKSRETLDDYYWFCLAHVRDYNHAWDYFAGFAPDEIEAAIREDTTWQRPTWRLGHMGSGSAHASAETLHDPFGFFSEDVLNNARRASRRVPAEEEAMRVMDLCEPLTPEGVKSRYKQLCKRHHPDANGGDKASEERFKRIGQAYKTLMDSLSLHT